MLSNPELFATVEAACHERGTIGRFEEENGKIKGHMMIDAVKLPEGVKLKPNTDDGFTAFEASFDFMDSRVGFAFNVYKTEAVSDFWCWGESPDEVWVELFVQTLVESISHDGSYGVPIYTFISDTGSFSCVPTAPDELEE